MARFIEVHRSAIDAADRRLSIGEIWNVAVREPLEFTASPVDWSKATTRIVRFKATRDGKLRPATIEDQKIIADWENRHRGTPLDRFGLPQGVMR